MKTRASSFSVLNTDKRPHSHSKPGFTIVELLIVIVVIAILAAITVVAYDGIQRRAQDTKVNTAMANYVRGIEIYVIQNGTYPPGSGAVVCLDGTSGCWSGANAASSTTVAAGLRTVMGAQLPDFSNAAFAYNTALSADPSFSGYYLVFMVNSSSCPSILNTIFLNSSTLAGKTTCRLGLPVQS